ncbi:hypothetical protein [Glycomyces sp. YM15]|uniref:hypothetical protein n=1 Tax=Glycomyces sp. YM15 TaxID=2800446 RepID=UPI00196251C8|nr:hypothetical protein [Glycomyces sp. YM15]
MTTVDSTLHVGDDDQCPTCKTARGAGRCFECLSVSYETAEAPEPEPLQAEPVPEVEQASPDAPSTAPGPGQSEPHGRANWLTGFVLARAEAKIAKENAKVDRAARANAAKAAAAEARKTARAARRKASKDDRADDIIDAAFYLVFLGGALYGQYGVYTELFHLPPYIAGPLSVALELAGVKFAREAAKRRAAGEAGLVMLSIAYAVASIVIGINGVGHWWLGKQAEAIIYGLLSTLAFVSFVSRSEFKKREADRADGRRALTRPMYGIRWITNPTLTFRAWQLAGADATLGLHGSLAKAQQQFDAERDAKLDKEDDRHIEKVLRGFSERDFEENPLFAEIDYRLASPRKIRMLLRAKVDHDARADRMWAQMEAERERTEQVRQAEIDAETEAERQERISQVRTEYRASIGAETANESEPNTSRQAEPGLFRKGIRKLGLAKTETPPDAAPKTARGRAVVAEPKTLELPVQTPVPTSKTSGPKKSRETAYEPVIPVEVSESEIAGMTFQEAEQAAIAWLAAELKAGGEPSARFVEIRFGFENSKGKKGPQLISKARTQIESEVKVR